MDRPKRERRQPKQIQLLPTKTRWTLKEKQLLLEAIKTHGKSNVKKLASCVKTKTGDEVQLYIRNLALRSNRTFRTKPDPELDAPLKSWLQLAEDLTSGIEDHSLSIAKVLSIAGNLEPHVPRRSYRDPDYRTIYQYLAAVIAGKDVPVLLDINAAVVVELLDDTHALLQSLDMSVQRRLMLHKYKLLKCVQLSDSHEEVYEANRKALENDLDFEEIEGVPKPTTSQVAPHANPPSSHPGTPTASPATPDLDSEERRRAHCQVAPHAKPVTATVSAARSGGPQIVQSVTSSGDTRMLLLPGPKGALVPVPVPTMKGVGAAGGQRKQKVHLSFPPGFILPPGRYRFEPVITPHANETGKPTAPAGAKGNEMQPGSAGSGSNVSVGAKQGETSSATVAASGCQKSTTVVPPGSSKRNECESGNEMQPGSGESGSDVSVAAKQSEKSSATVAAPGGQKSATVVPPGSSERNESESGTVPSAGAGEEAGSVRKVQPCGKSPSVVLDGLPALSGQKSATAVPPGSSKRNQSESGTVLRLGAGEEAVRKLPPSVKSVSVVLDRLPALSCQKTVLLNGPPRVSASTNVERVAQKHLSSTSAGSSSNVNGGSPMETTTGTSNVDRGGVSQAPTGSQSEPSTEESGQSEQRSVSAQQTGAEPKARRGSKRKWEGTTQSDLDCDVKKANKRMKRPALHSLNPFCLPVKYLNPRPKPAQ